MILKLGSKGEDVKKLQSKLGITADGSFGLKTEQAVKDYQKSKGLTVDGIVGNKTWNLLFNLSSGQTKTIGSFATYSPLSNHITKIANKKNEYIVLHYTAGSTSAPGSALRTKSVFTTRQASSDFVVDDATILQLNPDLDNYGTWHCGDKKYTNSKGGSLYGRCTNRNSIGIEICSNLKKGTSVQVGNHEGWSYSESTLNNVVTLVKALMKKYNIPLDRVIRHYDVSGKTCPGIIGYNNEILYNTDGTKTSNRNNSLKWEALKNRFK